MSRSAEGEKKRAYEEERAYWLRHADDHFDEADLPFIVWHHHRVVANFAVPEDEPVVEVGCGSGKLFRDHRRVIAVDFSPEILRKVKERFPHYEVVCASVDALPFRDGAIRNLAANNMLHHVKGEGLLEAAAAEIHRVVALHGQLYVNDRNPTLFHHLIILVTMSAKHGLRRIFGEFPGCGSFNEPLFTRRDWRRIERRFEPLQVRCYYSAAMWLVDSVAKGLQVVFWRRDRTFVARAQERALPWLARIERWCPRFLLIERTMIGRKRRDVA